MRVVVTGAAGFLGSHIAAAWLAEGASVAGIVRDADQSVPAGSTKHIADLRDRSGLLAVLQDADLVVHAAGVAQRKRDRFNGAQQTEDVAGLHALLEVCSNAAVRQFIHIGSIAVNGTGAGDVIASSSAAAPTTAYGRIKAEQERVLTEWAIRGQKCSVILRLPAVYGPRMGGRPARIAAWIMRGLPVPRNLGRRSMLYVENLAAAVIAAATVEGTFVVADGFTATPHSFAVDLSRALGLSAPRSFPVPRALQKLTGDIFADRIVDGSDFSLASGFVPPVDPQSAMQRTAQWLNSR